MNDGDPGGSSENTAARCAVVVTCHDDAGTVQEAIDSVREQRPRVEFVLVDDGSSDPTMLQILSELERDGITVLRQENQGQAAAAMAGVRATSAPYVMRFDADDVLVPDGVGILADALDQAADAAAAWGDVKTFGLTTFRIASVPALDPWLVTYTNCITGSGALFRRTALNQAGGWQLASGFEDWDLWLELAEQGRGGVYVPEVVFKYRRDSSGQLARWLPNTTEYYDELRRRHPRLFMTRAENRRQSPAPRTLKLAVALIEAFPGVPRLARIQLCELFSRLLWNGGMRNTSHMAAQAIAIRARRWRRT